MCGRFNVIDNPGLQALLRDLGIDLQLPAATKGGVNIAPTEPVLIARRIPAGGEAEEETSLETARWWLTPSWADEVSQKYAMFNARSETLARSPAFRGPFKRQRGVVPMSSFLEWRKEGATKQPWGITTEDNALAVAALWDVWEKGGAPLLSCTLVTTAAAPAFTPWHSRMPVLLTRAEQQRWLDNTAAIPADDALFEPRLKQPLLLAPLDRTVSNARNTGPELLEPVGDVVTLTP